MLQLIMKALGRSDGLHGGVHERSEQRGVLLQNGLVFQERVLVYQGRKIQRAGHAGRRYAVVLRIGGNKQALFRQV